MFSSPIGAQGAFIWADFGTHGNFNLVLGNYTLINTISTPYTNTFNITSDVSQSSWSNPGTMPIDVVFYTCKCRRDTNYDPLSAWNDGLFQEGSGTVGANANVYRSTPYSSKLFTAHWKVIGTKRVTLQPGELHRRTIKWSKPRGINEESFKSNSNNGDTNYTLANYSIVEMVVIHGYPAPVNVATPGNPPVASTTQSTISPGTVCAGIRKLLSYKYSTPVTKHFSAGNSLIQTGTVTNETELTLKVEFPN